MFGDDSSMLTNDDAVGIGLDLHGPANSTHRLALALKRSLKEPSIC
jgi:hypothetical protein